MKADKSMHMMTVVYIGLQTRKCVMNNVFFKIKVLKVQAFKVFFTKDKYGDISVSAIVYWLEMADQHLYGITIHVYYIIFDL